MATILKCKMCGGTLQLVNDELVAVCEYCGTKQTLPKIDNERKAQLYDRANHFRRGNEYDKAAAIYEQILNEDTKEVVIVDPAICPDYVLSHVKSKGYIPKAILLTHGHFDHVMGIEGWVSNYEIPVYLHEDEKEVLANPKLNLSVMMGKYYAYDNNYDVGKYYYVMKTYDDIHAILSSSAETFYNKTINENKKVEE